MAQAVQLTSTGSVIAQLNDTWRGVNDGVNRANFFVNTCFSSGPTNTNVGRCILIKKTESTGVYRWYGFLQFGIANSTFPTDCDAVAATMNQYAINNISTFIASSTTSSNAWFWSPTTTSSGTGTSLSDVPTGTWTNNNALMAAQFGYPAGSTFSPPTFTSQLITVADPTPSPTTTRTVTPTPSLTPSLTPTTTPSVTPTLTPTPSVTQTPSVTPSLTPSITPTLTPTKTPTSTLTPSVTPTNSVHLHSLLH